MHCSTSLHRVDAVHQAHANLVTDSIVAADEAGIRRCADTLREGGIVGLPTETVYGLAADATNDHAVERIFEVKGRPRNHPLIFHVDSVAAAQLLIDDPGDVVALLGARFWPGPLTLLGKARPAVSRIATGGRDTVAVRVPAHVATLRVIELLGRAVAAPSANRFGRVSPTSARHVAEDLGSDVDLILDGGPCEHGLESTILDITGPTWRVRRPGPVSESDIAAACEPEAGYPPLDAAAMDISGTTSGTLAGHYAPRRTVRIARTAEEARALAGPQDAILDCSRDPAIVARHLYAWLRQLDDEPPGSASRSRGAIVAILPTGGGLAAAIRDRLIRAASPVG
jgi:L-threonylcarbamoyladenylate synthase